MTPRLHTGMARTLLLSSLALTVFTVTDKKKHHLRRADLSAHKGIIFITGLPCHGDWIMLSCHSHRILFLISTQRSCRWAVSHDDQWNQPEKESTTPGMRGLSDIMEEHPRSFTHFVTSSCCPPGEPHTPPLGIGPGCWLLLLSWVSQKIRKCTKISQLYISIWITTSRKAKAVCRI